MAQRGWMHQQDGPIIWQHIKIRQVLGPHYWCWTSHDGKEPYHTWPRLNFLKFGLVRNSCRINCNHRIIWNSGKFKWNFVTDIRLDNTSETNQLVNSSVICPGSTFCSGDWTFLGLKTWNIWLLTESDRVWHRKCNLAHYHGQVLSQLTYCVFIEEELDCKHEQEAHKTVYGVNLLLKSLMHIQNAKLPKLI